MPAPFPETEYTDAVFKGLDVQRGIVASRAFYDCRFVRCAFTETAFESCRFVGCAFEDCDLSLIGVPGAAFTRTRFEACTLAGVNWTEAAWPKAGFLEPLEFRRCALNHSTFLGLSLKGLVVAECVARDVDFREADLTEADFTHTDLSDSLFVNTDLTDADFSHARGYRINAGENRLKRTKFSLPEAMSLLHSLDILLTE